MQTTDHETRHKKRSRKEKLLNVFRLTAEPTVKVYHGYGHDNCLTVFGHVFQHSPFPRKKYRQSFVRNSLALLRLFLVKPFAGIEVRLEWKGRTYTTCTDTDGFFRFEWEDKAPFDRGWVPVMVGAFLNERPLAEAPGRIFIPYETQYIFISDIDDTFLISHSGNLRKRLYVLFTQNARSRKPFDGVVRHYQLLAQSGTTPEAPNPFFFVSSSEWNLYEYILEFTAVNKIPRGVFLLSQLKRFSQLLKTGQNNHGTKFTRIVRILEAFPKHRVVLLGDSSQQDPYIYQSVVKHFPKQVHAVYIRDVFERNYQKVKDVLTKIEAAGVPCLFFKHSEEAILHSVKIGLVDASSAEEKLQEQPAQQKQQMA
ncbi:App1 family protein [Flavisolibacter nicotianae]|uniref:App1 family protein n=1 Tax=Flavisolibacter nicotianae TaxID=2364882 RepID=UPI000EAFF286|nr:phosphatase domain-containing protein [Flavisolibacter nicotianae]